ncbi:lipopolysaccharide heptosyltransferase I [Hydrogenimonas sp.]
MRCIITPSNIPKEPPIRLAIVKLSAMGDIVHAMVALQYIKKHLPDIEIDWIVEEAFAEILKHNPHIDNILPVRLKALKRNKSLLLEEIRRVREYAQNDYDLVIDAQGLLKSAITARLLGKKVAGFSRGSIREKAASFFYTKTVKIDYAANTIDRNVKVLSEPFGFEITPRMILDKSPFLFYKNPDIDIEKYFSKEKKNILLVIGSTWESRNYPKEQFAEVAHRLSENSLIVWGNEEERKRGEWIAAKTPHATLLPKMDLNTLKAVIDRSDLLIGNDTGPTHMAWALNRPSITLFGPTPVSRVYTTPINKVFKSPSVVNPYKLDRNDFSIHKIPPEDIAKEAQNMLKYHPLKNLE